MLQDPCHRIDLLIGQSGKRPDSNWIGIAV